MASGSSAAAHRSVGQDESSETQQNEVEPVNSVSNGEVMIESTNMAEDSAATASVDATAINNPDGPGIQGMVVTDPADLPEETRKKKKKARKSAAKRGLSKPTGMEEFFADAPLTPDQYEEMKARYDPDIAFLDRLTTAIQSFEFTRKLTPERRNVFYKWLHYGSIIVGSNVGTGNQNTEDMDKEQINAARSHVSIPQSLRAELETIGTDAPKYAVDFLECTKGFLSRRAPSAFAFDSKNDADLITTTIERFMDYLLQQEVCPEFGQDILATRNFCREASYELWSCAEAQRWLPGDFNIACSTLFGGSYSKNYDGETFWGDENKEGSKFVGQTIDEAIEIVGFAMAYAATEETYRSYATLTNNAKDYDTLSVVKVIRDQGFEIVDLFNPTAECKDGYRDQSDIRRPVGRVLAKPWVNPLSSPEDLTVEEQKLAETKQPEEQYEFYIEEIVMRNLSVGQKITATIHKLNCGVWFFDEFTHILPDFDTFLINELMEDYKEPRWLQGSYAPGVPGWAEETGEGEPGF